MKLAIHTSAYSELGLEQALALIADAGFRYVEIASDISETGHFEAHRARGDERTRLTALLERHGLQLAALDIGGWDAPLCIANLDESQRVTAVENVRHAVATTKELRCLLITSHLWGLPAEGARDRASEFQAAFLRSVDELAPVLNENGVCLNFMPHPGGFIEESDATVDLIRRAGCPHVGYTFGSSHSFVINRTGQTPADIILYAGDTLTHVLVSDTHDVRRIIAPPEVKAHEHTVPGRGDIDFDEVFTALDAIGYDRTLCVHLISERDRIVEAARGASESLEPWLRGGGTA